MLLVDFANAERASCLCFAASALGIVVLTAKAGNHLSSLSRANTLGRSKLGSIGIEELVCLREIEVSREGR